jgi:hypothetical protein
MYRAAALAGSIQFNPTPGNIEVSTSVGTGVSGTGTNMDLSSTLSKILTDGKTLAMGFLGLCAITAIIGLFYNLTRLGAAGDNERARRNALMGLLASGVSLAIFGGLGFVVGFFWNVIG